MEACYCIDGEGEVECDGQLFLIKAGTMYALDKNDKHILRAKTNMKLVCVFVPALKGQEKHNFIEG